MRAADDLQVVVGESDRAERRPSSAPRSRRRRSSDPPTAASARAPRSGSAARPSSACPPWAGATCGPSCADHLADLKLAQLPDHPRAERQADRERRQARRRRAERDVARHVQHRELRVERDRAGDRASAALRLQPIHHAIGSHAARSLHQHEIARLDERDRGLGGFVARSRSSARCAAGMPAATAASAQRRGRRAADREQQVDVRLRRPRVRRPACSADARSPSSSISPRTAMRRSRRRARQHVERAPGRGRVGVVAVVDDRDAARQPNDLAAVRRRPQQRRAFRHDRSSGTSNSERHRGCGQDVRQVPARRRAASSSRPRPARRDHARWCRRCRDRRSLGRAHVRRRARSRT